MKKYKRTAVIVLDSCGCGELPDAAEYGDNGANTLFHTVDGREDELPDLKACGFFNITGKGTDTPLMSYGRLRETSQGKDTLTGHFELMGAPVLPGYQTYPGGLPDEIIDRFEKETKLSTLGGGQSASGTEIIKEYGEEHTTGGKPIVYTSADSVFQVACSEESFGLERLYSLCETARNLFNGKNHWYNPARIIARPFIRSDEGFVRTANRHDYSVVPPSKTLLDKLSKKGLDVIGVGKIGDIFSSRGLTQSYHTSSNADGIKKTIELLRTDYTGLIFTNLVDFDMLYGHRRDKEGYFNALKEFDRALPEILSFSDKTLIIITADHGCDPVHHGTDHTREYVPVLISSEHPSRLEDGFEFGYVAKLLTNVLE